MTDKKASLLPAGAQPPAPKGNNQSRTQGSVPPLAQAGDTRPITRTDTDDMARRKLSKHDSTSKFGEEEQSKEKMSDIEDEKRRDIERSLQQRSAFLIRHVNVNRQCLDLICFCRYKTFELYYKDMNQLFDLWDRTQGTIYRQPSASDRSDHDDHMTTKRISRKQDRSSFLWSPSTNLSRVI